MKPAKLRQELESISSAKGIGNSGMLGIDCAVFVKMLGCDTARVTNVLGTLFLIIGFNRSTRDDPGCWMDEAGNRRDWDYVAEQTVASGSTLKELMASARKYNRLRKMSMHEYLRKEFKIKHIPKVPLIHGS